MASLLVLGAHEVAPSIVLQAAVPDSRLHNLGSQTAGAITSAPFPACFRRTVRSVLSAPAPTVLDHVLEPGSGRCRGRKMGGWHISTFPTSFYRAHCSHHRVSHERTRGANGLTFNMKHLLTASGNRFSGQAAARRATTICRALSKCPVGGNRTLHPREYTIRSLVQSYVGGFKRWCDAENDLKVR
jgi:hypothetical protein